MINKNITVIYKEEVYKTKDTELKNLFSIANRGLQSFRVDSLPAILQRSFRFREEEDVVVLESKTLNFSMLGDNPLFYEEVEGEVILNKTTHDVIEGFNLLDGYSIYSVDESTITDILMFVERVLEVKNEFVCDFIKNLHEKMGGSFYQFNDVLFKNIYDVALHSTEGFEKISKVNPRFIYENILNDDFKLNNEGKLNKVVELPKFAIKYMKENKLESCLGVFQDINAIDGNNLRILLEFFDNTKIFVKSTERAHIYLNFTRKLSNVATTYKYRVKDLLEYLIKQSFYYSKKGIFLFPLDEIVLLEDYLAMCERHELKYNKYPFLHKEHNIVMKNVSVLDNEERDKEFIAAKSKYEGLVSENDDYIIKTPKDIKDMVLEGNHLHHCVSEYVSKVIDGDSKIFFLRKKDEPNVPFVTIELDCDDLLVHTRGMFNEEPKPEEMKYINRWIRSLAKKTAKSA